MTKHVLIREYLAAYAAPVALLLATLFAVLFLPNIYQLAVPVVALGVGILMRPRSVSVIWVALYIILFLAAAGALALGRELPKMPDDNQGLAPASLLFTGLLLFLYLAATVLPALWIGRWLGNEFAQHRHQESSPA